MNQRRIFAAAILVLAGIVAVLVLMRTSGGSPSSVLLHAAFSFTHPGWDEIQVLTDDKELKCLADAWNTAEARRGSPANFEPPFYLLSLSFANQSTISLAVMHDLQIFDLQNGIELFFNLQTMEILQKYAESLRQQRFGRLMAWSEVNELFARYDVATITDLETGLSLRTQRRGGTLHADIQPLTKQDTVTLKQIYGGTWSWNRRAVVLEIDGQRIAASMNGMPHGRGALANGFPGHHCLHYLGSITHGGRNRDPAHQLMVHYAAGLMHDYLETLDPAYLQQVMLEMAGQGESDIVQLGTLNRTESDLEVVSLVRSIRDIKIWSVRHDPPSDGEQVGHYSLSIYYAGDTREHRVSVRMVSRYIGEQGRWLVEPDFIRQLVGPSR